MSLDPAGDFLDLGSMPLGMALAPEKDKVVVILSGWREQGIQVIDLKSMRVTQTLQQKAAFYGIAFSQDGRTVYASGGNDDSIFCYSWNGATATFERKIVLGKQKPDKTGSRYPAGIAASRNGKFLYVAENVGESLAVVNLETSEVVQRIPTDHYPYAVEFASDGKIYVSAWGGNTISVLRARSDGTLYYERRIAVGRHPSALAKHACLPPKRTTTPSRFSTSQRRHWARSERCMRLSKAAYRPIGIPLRFWTPGRNCWC